MPAPQTLRTERLQLERFTIEHVPELVLLDTNAAVQATIFGLNYTYAETYARAQRRVAFWNENGYGDYVVHTHGGTYVGCAGMFPAGEPGAIAMGYALLPDFWGCGYATELATALAPVALTLAPTVVATVLEDHVRSRRVLEKSGFVLTGPNPQDPGTVLYRYEGISAPRPRV
jgi:RimJ/RimL family protein N-acetyltransferase